MCIKRLRTYYFTMNVIAIRAPFTTRVHRNVKIHAICDPDQYDTEINSARGFSHQKIRMKPVTQQRSNAMFYDPDQYDPEANQRSVLNEAVQLIDEISKTGDVTFGEVIEAQNLWAQSIVDISNSFLTGGDYVKLAGECAGELYGYGHSNVLFKPTKAIERQFRPTANDAMSYFVGNDAVISGYKEDQGFAINAKKGFSKVVFENHQVDCHSDVAHAMGTYEFTCATTGEISEVEYTFGYKRNSDGKVRICLHHSSIPYESSNKPRRAKTSPVKQKHVIFYDPDQYDHEENQMRHVGITS